jgi:hypothetical protein
MSHEHYKQYSCGHKERDLSWHAWITTRVCRGGEQIELVDGLCHECKIYETAKEKILAAREKKKEGGK